MSNGQDQIVQPTREMPSDIPMEMKVLGSLLLDTTLAPKLLSFLRDDSFYHQAHQLIFSAIKDIFQKENTIDIFLLESHLESTGELDKVGGMIYISSLTDIASVDISEKYSRIVEAHAEKRRVFQACALAARDCLKLNTDVNEITQNLIKQVGLAVTQPMNLEDNKLSNIVMKGAAALESNLLLPSYVTGVPFGIPQLDQWTGGAQPGNLYMVGARTRHGKTALALSFAYNQVNVPQLDEYNQLVNGIFTSKYPVGFMSIEMPQLQVFYRLASIEILATTGFCIPYDDIFAGRLSSVKKNIFDRAMGSLVSKNLHIDPDPVSLATLGTKVAYLIEKFGVKIIYIDYVQLVKGHAGKRQQTRPDEIADIQAELKRLAKYHNIPIIALSQIERETEKGTPRKPGLADLKGSGALEEGSDVIFLLFRPEVYYEEFGDEMVQSQRNMLIVDVAKNKNGKTGEILIPYDVALNSFPRQMIINNAHHDYMKRDPVFEDLIDDYSTYEKFKSHYRR